MRELYRRSIDAALWIVPLGFWAFAHYFTYKYASNVPYWDAWEYVEIVAGRRPLTWQVVWEQHNEHRIVWQTLFEIGWGRLTNWNQYLAAFFPFLFLGAAYALLLRRAIATRPWLTTPQRWLLAGALSLFMFSFRQYDHLIWEMMLCWGLLVLAMVLFAGAFTRYVEEGGGWRQTTWLAALVLVAAFSTGQGLAVNIFVVVAGALGLALGKRLPRGYWALALWSVALVAIYFVGYTKPAHHPPVTAALADLRTLVDYVLALLGGVVAWDFTYAWRVGVGILALALAVVGVLLWRDGLGAIWQFVARYPLVPMMGILLGAIVVGRVGLGAAQATASRYVPFTIVLLVPIVLAAIDLLRGAGGRAVTAALAVVVLALAPVWYLGYRQGLHEGWVRRNDLRSWRDCVLAQPSAIGTCDGKGVYPVAEILARRTLLLREEGLCFFADAR